MHIEQLYELWAEHPIGKSRATGGRHALSGFTYQLYVSLDVFFTAVDAGNGDPSTWNFDGLSDLAHFEGEFVYLTQVKKTLQLDEFRDALAEFIAVDKFLEEKVPSLRENVYFVIAAPKDRRQRRTAAVDLAFADTGLPLEDAGRWEKVRKRVRPVEEKPISRLSLAIRFFPKVANSLEFVDKCVACLLEGIAGGRDGAAIATDLMELRTDARIKAPALPSELLTLDQLEEDEQAPGNNFQILQGATIRPANLKAGQVMPRAQLVESITSKIDEIPTDQRSVPIIWLTGASGSGKSAALLLTLRQLLHKGWAAYFLGNAVHLPVMLKGLGDIRNDADRVVVAIDDMYAPNQRDETVWNTVFSHILNAQWARSPLILTCGPNEQLHEFRRAWATRGDIHVVPITIAGMERTEQEEYHKWYEQRTGTTVPFKEEKLLVVVAWIYDLWRRQQIKPETAAHRFHDRLRDLRLEAAGHAALAVNRLNIPAPSALFDNNRDQIDRLIDEFVFRPQQRDRQGYFFHPKISDLIYQAIVPQDPERRSTDLVTAAMAAMEDRSWLDVIFRRLMLLKNRPEDLIPVEVVQAFIFNLWQALRDKGIPGAVTAELWWHWFRLEKQYPGKVQAGNTVQDWLAEKSDPDTYMYWPLLFQMTCHFAPKAKLPVAKALQWLSAPSNFDNASWTFNWQALWDSQVRSDDLILIGFTWLDDHCGLPGWGYIWQRLEADEKVRQEWQGQLLTIGLNSIRKQERTAADAAIWQKIIKLGPKRADIIDALVQNLSRTTFPEHDRARVDVLCKVIANDIDEYLLASIDQFLQADGRPFLLLQLISRYPNSKELDTRAFRWLEGREDRAEWNYVWQALLGKNFRPEELLPIGYGWLKGREDRAEWNYVWRALAGRDFRPEELLPTGYSWLRGREDRAEWTHVWRALLGKNFRRDELLPTGYSWLEGREDRAEWAHVWRALLGKNFRRDELLPTGYSWLKGREDRAEWSHVWQALAERDFRCDELLPIGYGWLKGREDRAEWSHVWQALLGKNFRPEELLPIGYGWLKGREDRAEWAHVWQALLGKNFRPEELLPIGYSWLKGREDRAEWSYVWQALAEKDFRRDELLPIGYGWLEGREDRAEWNYVRQALLGKNFRRTELLNWGRKGAGQGTAGSKAPGSKGAPMD